MLKIETEFDPEFAAYRKVPLGSIAIPLGLMPSVGVTPVNVSAPAVTLKPTITPRGWLAALTYRKLPEGVSCMLSGVTPIEKGEFGTGVRAPLPLSIEKTEMLLEPAFPEYKKAPAESTSRICGSDALGAIEVRGNTSVKTPLLAIVNKEISLSALPAAPGFAAYRNFPDGW